MKTVATPDHVDEVLAQWARERPDLDTSPVAVVARVGRAARCLDHGLEEVFGEHGLSREAFDVLATLRRAGHPYQLTPTALYRSLMRTSGAITNRLHRLEEAGLVARIPDSSDGRGLLVSLTAEGRRRLERVLRPHLDNERRLLGALTAAEQRQLARLLKKLLLSFEADRDRRSAAGAQVPGGTPPRRSPTDH